MAKQQTLSSLILQQKFLSILLLTLVVVAVWVGFTIYFSYSRSTVTTTDAALIAPLTPKLDSTLFTRLSARKSWTDAELASFQPSVVVTTTGTPAPSIPVATVSASILASPSASQP